VGQIQQWCDRTDLFANPCKTIVIPFTKKRALKGQRELTLFGKTIHLSREVKYLGLKLAKGLAWVHSWKKSRIESTEPFGSTEEDMGPETKDSILVAHHGDKTHNHLCYHSVESKGRIQD
jgi:hypothetical protein